MEHTPIWAGNVGWQSESDLQKLAGAMVGKIWGLYHFPFRGDQLLYKGIYDVIITLVGSTLPIFFRKLRGLSQFVEKKYDYFSDKSGCIF
jgi:hypothetical protein